eukprot:TRINITY_DN3151_c0_g1_i1.p1 TRINITY_DN3151_c0_g1~~TRINITY_DN3151_c0_g1_i1.p1  ORF type:complete len:483 (+),score=123.10 TRINITY_DN3151_c0_g1_i1:257-1705(+)
MPDAKSADVVYVALFVQRESWGKLCQATKTDIRSTVQDPHVLLGFSPSIDHLEKFYSWGKEVDVVVTELSKHRLCFMAKVEIDDPVFSQHVERPLLPITYDASWRPPRGIDRPRQLELSVALCNDCTWAPCQRLRLQCNVGIWATDIGAVVDSRRLSGVRLRQHFPRRDLGGDKPRVPEREKESTSSAEFALYQSLRNLPASATGDPLAMLREKLPNRKFSGQNMTEYPAANPLLHVYAKSGWFEGVQYLLELGANVNLKRAKDMSTPLHLAIQSACDESTSRDGHTPDHWLIVIAFLIHSGADPFCNNSYGEAAGEFAESLLQRAPLPQTGGEARGKKRMQDWKPTAAAGFTAPKRRDSGTPTKDVVKNDDEQAEGQTTPTAAQDGVSPLEEPAGADQPAGAPPSPPPLPSAGALNGGVDAARASPVASRPAVPSDAEMRAMVAHRLVRLAHGLGIRGHRSKADYIDALRKLSEGSGGGGS